MLLRRPVIPVKTGIQKNRFLLKFIPMEIGAGMTKTHMWPIVKNCSENKPITPSPLAGEGEGEGDHTRSTPTLILPHQGGG